MLEIYSELAQNVVFTHFYKGMDMPYSLWYEVQKCYPYHSNEDHSIKKCTVLRYDVEPLISIGKIQVESTPRV